MTRLLPLLILAGLAAELASIILVGGRVGLFPALLLLFAGGVLGISLIRSAGTSIAAAVRSPVQVSSLQRDAAGQALGRVVSGLLFLIPGFFSDLVGFLLLFTWVRRWLLSRLRGASSFSPGAPGRGGATIIEGEVVEITGELHRPDPPPGQSP